MTVEQSTAAYQNAWLRLSHMRDKHLLNFKDFFTVTETMTTNTLTSK